MHMIGIQRQLCVGVVNNQGHQICKINLLSVRQSLFPESGPNRRTRQGMNIGANSDLRKVRWCDHCEALIVKSRNVVKELRSLSANQDFSQKAEDLSAAAKSYTGISTQRQRGCGFIERHSFGFVFGFGLNRSLPFSQDALEGAEPFGKFLLIRGTEAV